MLSITELLSLSYLFLYVAVALIDKQYLILRILQQIKEYIILIQKVSKLKFEDVDK
jgi:hypothetical protein